MRIIAGQRRGHKIDGPKASSSTRPTTDLVRESLFNILGDLVVGRPVFDLFAGTGALGLEALSRGAQSVTFVERDRANVGLIHRNIATLRYEGSCQVKQADAYRWARSYERSDLRPAIFLLDPPYRDYEIRAKALNQVIARLVEVAAADSVIVIEAGWILDERILPEFETWDVRRYGDTRIAIKVIHEKPDVDVPAAVDVVSPVDEKDHAIDELEEKNGG